MSAENFMVLQASGEASLQESLFQLYASLLRQYIEPAFGWDEPSQRERFRREYPPERAFLVSVHSEEAGFFAISPLPESVHVSLLLLRRGFQGRGLGRAVMRQILRDANAQQLPVTLCCFRSNVKALQFYRSLGFLMAQEDEFFLTLTSARQRWPALRSSPERVDCTNSMRCTLRPYAPSDENAFVGLFADPEVVRWVDDGQFDDDRVRRLFARILTLETGPTEPFAFVLAVWLDDALVGHIELKQTEHTRRGEWELVYLLARRVWGRGLGTELASWALQTTHGEGRQLMATVDPDNAASLRILTRCGLGERARLADGTVVLGEPDEVKASP